MAEYTAATAAINLVPKAPGFHAKAARITSGVTTKVTVVPEFARVNAPSMRPIPVSVQPTIDNNALARIDRALRALPKTELPVDASQAERAVQELRARLETLRDKVVNLRVSDQQARAEISLIQRDLDAIDRMNPTIAVAVDAAAASAALGRVEAEKARVSGRPVRIPVDVDVGRAMSGLATLTSALWAVSAMSVSPRIDVDVSAALSSIARVIGLIHLLGGLGGTLGGLAGGLGGVGAAGLVAGAGLGAAVLASLGVGKALSAMSAQQDAAGSTARQSAQQQAQSAFQVESAHNRLGQAVARASQARREAARSVERAEQQAARAVASALAQQEAAQRRLSSAQRDARAAQAELTRAWESGRRAIQDLQDQLDMSQIDMRQATEDLRDAHDQLGEAMASGDQRAITRAQIAYDRQVEAVDQLGKRTQRLGVDNASVQRAGVAGSDQYTAALDRVRATSEQVADAERAAGQATAAVAQARADGAVQVADAREQAQQRISAADEQVVEAQRALTQALSQTGSAGAAAADKVAAAFGNLSPAAAAFARYLFGLQPILRGLSATAAGEFFPPLQQGIDTLLTRLPLITTVTGQLAGGMGAALRLVLVELASPFWASFFTLLGNSAGLIPLFAGATMQLAAALAVVVMHLMPLAPAGFALLSVIAQLVTYLAPFIAQLLGGLIPAADALLRALFPLGPVLGALQPILLVLGQAFAQVLGAILAALAPILIALTPLIQTLAVTLATQLVGAIEALTPFLVGLATWASQHPGLVMGVVGAVLAAIPVFNALGSVFAFLFGPIALLRLAMLATGMSLTGLLAPIGGVFAGIARMLGVVTAATGPFGVLGTVLSVVGAAVSKLGGAVTGLLMRIVAGLGPIGMLITIFSVLFVTNEQFRGAVVGLLGVLGQLVGQVISALMPAINALLPVLTMTGTVFAGIATGLVTVLVPIVNALAAVLQWLTPILTPLLAIFLGVRAAMMLWAAAQWALNIAMAANPISLIVLAVAALVGAVVWAYQNVGWFRDAVNALWSGLQIAFSAIGAAATWLWVNVLSPVFSAIGAFIGWVWTNVIEPPLKLFGWVLTSILGPALQWFYYLVVKPIFDAIGAAISWVYDKVIKPAIDNWVLLYRTVLAPVFSWLYDTIIKPIMDAVGVAFETSGSIIDSVCGGIADAWNWVTGLIRDVYNATLKPIIDAVKGGFEAIKGAVDWVTGTDPIPPPPGYAAGGLVVPVGYALGGFVGKAALPGFAAGGSSSRRPRPGPTDTVPSLLTVGEWVMTRLATARMGSAGMGQLMGLLERDPAAAKVLTQVVATLSGGSAGPAPGAGTGAGVAGYMRGGPVLGFAGGGQVPTPAGAAASTVSVVPDVGATDAAAASTSLMAGSMTAALTAAQGLNPALSGLAATQQGLLVPAQAAVTTGQQAMASTVTGTLLPAMGLAQAAVGVAAPLAHQALQGAQLGTQISTALTAQNTAANAMWMANATTGMSVASQAQHGMLRLGQLATRVSTDQTALNAAVNNASMAATTGQMSAVSQSHLAGLRGAQGVTAQSTTAFADAWRDQLGRTVPDSRNPISWVISYPIRSLTDAWNHLDAQFALGKHVPPYVPNFATGGIYPGYTPGRDVGYAHVSGGEAIMRPEWTRAVGTEYVRGANAAARRGGRQGVSEFLNSTVSTSPRAEGRAKLALMRRYPLDNGALAGSFAYGGVAPHVALAGDEVTRVVGRMPGGIGGRGSRGNASDHPSGFALDFMTLSDQRLGDRVAGHLQQHAERLAVKYIIWKQSINQGKGWNRMEDRGSVTANHFDHVHTSFEGGPMGGSWGDGPAGSAGFFDPAPIVNDAFKKAFDQIADVPKFFGPSAQVARDQGVAAFSANKVKEHALAKISEKFAVASGGPGAEQWRGVALEALRRTGQPLSLVDRVLQQIQIESSGNPRSINLWDINARRGTPSKGLIQTIDPTFQDYRDRSLPNEPYDPLANIVAGIRYAIARYGGIERIWPKKMGYDQGGLAFGKGVMLKDVVAPERVLSPVQTRDYDTLARATRQLDVGQAAARAALAEQPQRGGWPDTVRLQADAIEIRGDGLGYLIGAQLVDAGEQISDGRTD